MSINLQKIYMRRFMRKPKNVDSDQDIHKLSFASIKDDKNLEMLGLEKKRN